MWAWNFTSVTTLITIITVISNAKKRPANLVEIVIPRTIMNDAKAKKIRTQTIHGTLCNPATL